MEVSSGFVVLFGLYHILAPKSVLPPTNYLLYTPPDWILSQGIYRLVLFLAILFAYPSLYCLACLFCFCSGLPVCFLLLHRYPVSPFSQFPRQFPRYYPFPAIINITSYGDPHPNSTYKQWVVTLLAEDYFAPCQSALHNQPS